MADNYVIPGQDNTPTVPVSLDTVQPPQMDQLSIDTQASNNVLPSQQTVASRAAKVQYGLGNVLGTDYKSTYNTIANGGEDALRTQAASSLDALNAQNRQQLLQELAINKGSPLTQDDIAKIGFDTTGYTPIDPTSVFEQSYAHKVVDTLHDAANNMGNNTFLDEAGVLVPTSVETAKKQGREDFAWREFVETQIENANDAYNKQSTLGAVADWLKPVASFGMYDEAKLRGLMAQTGIFDGLGLANNLEDQSKEFSQMPFDQRTAKFSAIMKKLTSDNPSLAKEYGNAILGMSVYDQREMNVNSAVNFATLPGIGTIAKTLLRPTQLINQTRNAVANVIEGASIPKVTPASLANSAGDLESGAVHQAAANVMEDLRGQTKLDQRSTDALTSNFNLDAQNYRAAPGRFGQEIVNRLDEANLATSNNMIQTIDNSIRVDRMGDIMASEKAVSQLKDEIKDRYTGPNNKILNIHDPIYDGKSNTYWFPVDYGREDGTLHSSEQAVRNDALLNGLVPETPSFIPQQIADRTTYLEGELKILPTMDADTQGLNHFQAMRDELSQLKSQQADLDRRGMDGYAIKQNGLGFYLQRHIPLNETSNTFRDLLDQTETKPIASSWVRAAVNWIRTPEDTLSATENAQRKIATHGPSYLLQNAKEGVKDIEKLPKKYWKEWERVVDQSRFDLDENGLKGNFAKSPQELEDTYQHIIGRMPEKAEIMAYFAFKRNVEVDRVYRTINLYRNKARLGIEQHSFSAVGADGNKKYSSFVEGVQRFNVPIGEDNIAIMTNHLGGEKIVRGNAMGKTTRNELEENVKTGKGKMYEIYDPERRELSNFSSKLADKRIRFVYSENAETKPLQYENQVPRRGGGHFDADYDWYIKQAKITPEKIGKSLVHWYEGDRTLMPIANTGLGKKVVDHMNNVRQLLLDGKEAEAKAYNEQHLPFKWDEHSGWYKASRDQEGNKVPPRYSKEEPFQLVPRNKNINDMDKGLANRYPNTFRDGTRQGSLARTSQVEYTGERDAYDLNTINDHGTKGNPDFKYEPANFVDPMTTMNRALNRIMNSVYMDDYKISAVERWLRRASPYLKTEENDLRHSPFYYFANPEWKNAVDPTIQSALKADAYKINQFVGIPSKTDTYLFSVASHLSESIYNRFGPKAAMIPDAMLPYVRNPLAFMRSVTFHMKLGLFSVPQFFKQFTTASNVFAIAGPRHMPAGMTAVVLHQYARLNNSAEILEHMDNIATKMQLPGTSVWKPGEWKEAYDLMKRTGFFNIGGEHAFLDNPLSNKVFSNGKQTFLDWGESFFREGASNTRASAWYVAYKEFRELHPTGAIGRQDVSKILDRAALLDHNMSRASNSMLNTGIMSIPGQFMAYSLRLAEMMIGSRLTVAEKTRLFAVSSVLYGIPIGGLGLFGVPVGDYIKHKAQDAGYVVGDNWVNSALMEGLPAAVVASITGGGDAKKGNWYNFSQFGDKGIDTLQEFIDSDKTIWDVLGGASFSTLSDGWAQTSGLRNWAMNMIRGDNEQFPLKTDDFIGPMKEIASVNDSFRLLSAIHTGRWMSKHDTYLSDVSPLSAMFQTVTGVTDQRVADISVMSGALKQQEALEKYGLSKFVEEIHHAIQAEKDGDEEQAKQYFTRAQVYMETTGYPLEKRGSAMAIASQGYESLIDRLAFKYLVKEVPPKQAATRFNTFTTMKQIEYGNQ